MKIKSNRSRSYRMPNFWEKFGNFAFFSYCGIGYTSCGLPSSKCYFSTRIWLRFVLRVAPTQSPSSITLCKFDLSVCWWRRGCHFLGSCHARHGTKATAIQLLFPWGTFPSIWRKGGVLLLAPFPFRRLSSKMFELLFCPTAICGENCDLLLSAFTFAFAFAILISCRRLGPAVGVVIVLVLVLVPVLVLWQLCILFRYLSHSLANAAQSFA